MWYSVMKEFDCSASSTWSNEDEQREKERERESRPSRMSSGAKMEVSHSWISCWGRALWLATALSSTNASYAARGTTILCMSL